MSNWAIGSLIQQRWEVCDVFRGGMGEVYVVYDRDWQETLAVKTFQDDILAQKPAAASRFLQEALVWVNLEVHRNIAEARMVHEIEGKPLLFLEYVSGGDLSHWIGAPRLKENLAQVVSFALQFCDGMLHAASKGLKVHRDIKPHNCLISRDRVLKITDFGLAKILDVENLETEAYEQSSSEHEGTHLTRTASGMGTPAYMAPEQFRNARMVDVRADVYSFGILLFEMMTGELPFTGSSAFEFEVQHKIEPAPVLKGAGSPIAAIVEKSLAKNPQERFKDFAEIRRRLGEIHEQIHGEPPPVPCSGLELDADRQNNKGLSLYALGRYNEALTCFQQSLKLNSSSVPVWSNQGVTLGVGLGKWDLGLLSFEKALELNPGDPQAWSNKGMALRSLGQVRESLACYDRALQLNSFFPEALSNKGAALKSLGRSNEAKECLEAALSLDSRSDEAWTNLGVVLGEGLGRWPEAISCYDRALKINSRDKRHWSNKGTALIALRRPEEALECLDLALKIDPRFEVAWMNKGIASNLLELTDEAIRCYCVALEINPNYVKAWSNLGNAYSKVSRTEEAIGCYDRALEFDPAHAGSWYNKGVVLLQLERLQDSLYCFTEAQHSGHPHASKMIERLRNSPGS